MSPSAAQAVAAHAQPPAPSGGNDHGKAAPVVMNPFVRAAREHVEPFWDDTIQLVAGNAVARGPIDVPAYGYLRHVLVLVTAAGGVGSGTAAVAAEDAPWSSLASVTISDVNSQTFVGPITGYDLYLANKWGAYSFQTDPALGPEFSDVSAGGNFTFLLRIPIEITGRDGLGALPNMASNATYKVNYTIAAPGSVYTTSPAPTLPAVRVMMWGEFWSQPPAADLRGLPNVQEPPARGTTQFWSKTQFNVAAGEQRFTLTRVGNLLRNIIFVFRTTAPARSTTNFPDPFRIDIDGINLVNIGRTIQRRYMGERYGLALGARDVGVLVVDLTHDLDYHPGDEMRDGYIPTSDATRVQLNGVFGAAGVLDVLTNDVKPAGDVYVHEAS